MLRLGEPQVTFDDVRTDWLRIPLSQPIADTSHVLRFIDLILVGLSGVCILECQILLMK